VSENSENAVKNQLGKRIDLLSKLDLNKILLVSDIINSAYDNSRTIFLAGNGGSSSTVQHFAVDLGTGSLEYSRAVRVLALSENSAVVTATANDHGVESIFARQIKLLGQSGDYLFLFTASGNSENLLHANEMAIKMGMTTVSFTGFDGGAIKSKTTHNVHISTAIGDYGLVEDVHLVLCHILTDCQRENI
jgi:D-sedoheptulose 7-phosphate isomerase